MRSLRASRGRIAAVTSALALSILLSFTQTSAAAETCGSPALTVEELNQLARDLARADRVAPHDPLARAEHLRSAFVSLRARSTSEASAVAPMPGVATDADLWQPGFGLPGIHEYPEVAVEFRGELVVAGWVRTAGGRPMNGIARWTDQGWQPLGDGVYPSFALAILNDRLYAGEYGRVSVWDGESWTRFANVPFMNIHALFVHDGVLFAAGNYGTKGRVARLNGSTWQIVGGDFDADVKALGSFRGALVAGGNFRNYENTPCGYVARWNGATWEAIGSGVDPSDYSGVNAIQEFNDRLIVGGWFSSCYYVPTPGLASWDGTSWKPLPGALAALVYDLMEKDGSLYIAGSFAGDYSAVVHWDGATWRSDGIEQWVLGLASYHGELTAVGGFYGAGCPTRKRITSVATLHTDGWGGYEQWDDSMHGLTHNAGAASLYDAVVYKDELVVGGIVGLAGSPPELKAVSSPVRLAGQDWQSMAGGPCASTFAVVGEDLIAGSIFGGIARWDGTAWYSMGSGLDGMIWAIAEYDGKIYAGGENLRVGTTGPSTTLASFDGVEWSPVPYAPATAELNTARISALEVIDGLLYVGGNFEGVHGVASPSILAWDGARWRGVGGGLPGGSIAAIESYDGEIYVGGPGVMHWDGFAWHAMGLDGVQVLSLGRYGDKLVIGGNAGVDRFVPGSLGLVSWDGEQWGGFGAGINGQVYAIEQLGEDLYVAGSFSSAGSQASFSVARWGGSSPLPPPPPPTVQPPASPDPVVALAVRSAVVTSNQAKLFYSLPEAGSFRLELFDVRGARVAMLRDAEAAAGTSQLEWSSDSPAPFPQNGIYFLRLTSHGKVANAKVVFAR